MIRVYVHNTEDWIGENDPNFSGLLFIDDENYYQIYNPWDWTEIGEL